MAVLEKQPQSEAAVAHMEPKTEVVGGKKAK
jgi:hypothetical protein